MKNCEYQQIDPRALRTPSSRTSSTLPCGRKGSQRLRRKWEVFPGKNRFYCDGRIMLARQCGVLPLTIGLIFITSVLFFTFDCPFLVDHLTVFIPVIGGVLFIFVVISLLQTSFTDPGILPRALPDEAADIEKQIDNSGSSTYRPPPRTKEILINDQVVKLKYCFTCKMFRPPRTSHCSLCDNCVERFDHHCPWVGNCVGKRNYRFFYAFIVSLSFLTSFIFGCVITHLTLRSQGGNGFIQAIQDSPASVVELVICFFSIWSILGLSGFHTYLVASNLTTNEDIKGSWSSKRGEESGNPYTYNNIFTNCCVVLCGPMPPSLIDRRGFVPPEDAPQTVTSDAELPAFMAKNDTNMEENCQEFALSCTAWRLLQALWRLMCAQGTKELLESMANSTVIQSTCAPGKPKTAPVTQESLLNTVSITVSPPSKPPSNGCSGRQARRPIDVPCSQRGLKRAALHTHKPMLRLPSPLYSLSDSPLILSDAPDMGFIPLNWAQYLCHQQSCANTLHSVTRTASHFFFLLFFLTFDVLSSGSSQETCHLSTKENKPALFFFSSVIIHLMERIAKLLEKMLLVFNPILHKKSADDQCFFMELWAISPAFCHPLRPNAIILRFQRSFGSKQALLWRCFYSFWVVLKACYNKVIG